MLATALAAALIALAPPADRLTAEQVAEDLRAFQSAAESNWSYHELRTMYDALDLPRAVSESLARMPDGATPGELARELRLLVAALHDGHAGVRIPGDAAPRTQRLPFELRECVEGLIVSAVSPEAAGPGAPLPGDRLVSIGGVPADDLLGGALPFAVGSTPGMRRVQAVAAILNVPTGTTEVELESPDGTRRRWAPPEAAPPAPGEAASAVAQRSLRAPRLDWPADRVARLAIPTFTVDDWDGWRRAAVSEREKFLASSKARLDETVDAALAGGPRAVILDLRGNSGGTDLLGIHLAQRFLAEPFHYFKLSARHDGKWFSPSGYIYNPRPPTFDGPLVVLADERVFSTTDNFLRCLDDLHPNLTVIGRPTGAGTGAPTAQTALPHSGAIVTFCVQRVYGPKGKLIEGSGTGPDIPVTWARRDLIRGLDPDLAAALAFLGVAPAAPEVERPSQKTP